MCFEPGVSNMHTMYINLRTCVSLLTIPCLPLIQSLSCLPFPFLLSLSLSLPCSLLLTLPLSLFVCHSLPLSFSRSLYRTLLPPSLSVSGSASYTICRCFSQVISQSWTQERLNALHEERRQRRHFHLRHTRRYMYILYYVFKHLCVS